jgi:hypothetical protein
MRNLATERCLRATSVATVLITRVLHAQVTSNTSGYLRDSSRAIVPSGGDGNSKPGQPTADDTGYHLKLINRCWYLQEFVVDSPGFPKQT